MNNPLPLIPSAKPLKPFELVPWKAITRYEAEIDGYRRSWEEYVPSCYNGEKSVPLVLSLHGGANQMSASRTTWAGVAERENFIIVYPHCFKKDEIRWNAWREFTAEDGFPDDVAYLDRLIEIVEGKYHIDKTRMYIHGQSVGDKMASTYVFERGYRFAAAALMSGPMGASCFVAEDGSIKYGPQYPLPVARTHGTEDLDIPLDYNCVDIKWPFPERTSERRRRDKMLAHQVINNMLWRNINGCDHEAQYAIRGRYNAVYYRGNPYDFCFYTVNGGVHSPSCDMADFIWCYFFSGFARIDGQVVRCTPLRAFAMDENCVALADGAQLCWAGGKTISVGERNGAALERDGILYAPAELLHKAFGGRLGVTVAKGGLSTHIETEADSLTVYAGVHTAILNGHYVDMPPSLLQGKTLYVPVAAVAARLLKLYCVSGFGVYYLTPHAEGVMSYDLAYLIKLRLGLEKPMTALDCLKLERELIQEWTERGGVVYNKATLPKN